MAELFSDTGVSSKVALGPPPVKGIYLPGVDNRFKADGYGFVTPWGSGATARTYTDYGTSAEADAGKTQLRDIGNSIGVGTGAPISYNLTGLVGPQGPMGSPGPAGSISVQQILLPIGSADLNTILQQLAAWNATTDTLLYGGGTHIVWNETWIHMPVAAIKTWNDFAIDQDGSFMALASDSGVYISTDSGTNWTLKNPESGHILGTGVSDADGNAIALAENSQDYGKLWVSTDSGVNWTKIQISTA